MYTENLVINKQQWLIFVFNWNHFEMRLLNLRINFFYLLRTFCPHRGSFFFFFLYCFFFLYVSVKIHLWPSSGDLPRPRIGMLSLVTVSPVITAFHSCCLSHHVFDQVNLWTARVGFETAIFWQCSLGTVDTQRLHPLHPTLEDQIRIYKTKKSILDRPSEPVAKRIEALSLYGSKIAVSNPTQAVQRFTWSKTWCDRQQLWKAVITGDTVTRLSIPIRGRGKSPEEGQRWNLAET